MSPASLVALHKSPLCSCPLQSDDGTACGSSAGRSLSRLGFASPPSSCLYCCFDLSLGWFSSASFQVLTQENKLNNYLTVPWSESSHHFHMLSARQRSQSQEMDGEEEEWNSCFSQRRHFWLFQLLHWPTAQSPSPLCCLCCILWCFYSCRTNCFGRRKMLPVSRTVASCLTCCQTSLLSELLPHQLY